MKFKRYIKTKFADSNPLLGRGKGEARKGEAV
jgi:hypothetical protein